MLQPSILFCILAGDRPAVERIEKLISKVRVCTPVTVVRQLDEVRAALLYRPREIQVAVCFASTRQDLLDLQSVWPLLRDTRTILIIPDCEAGTIAVAHTMRPRFISCGDRDFHDVEAVLEKMTGISLENGSMRM